MREKKKVKSGTAVTCGHTRTQRPELMFGPMPMEEIITPPARRALAYCVARATIVAVFHTGQMDGLEHAAWPSVDKIRIFLAPARGWELNCCVAS